MRRQKYLFIVGGVMSGVGKGVTTASISKLLQARGFRVNPMKIDPYLNVDAGTMNPIEHGEVFVLDSGLECDQDMGNYERFLDESLPAESYMTNGMVYKYIIDKERALGYGGKCVDPVPYLSEEILRRIDSAIKKTKSDITVIEIGGTVGEYQNAIFLEAARVLKLRHPQDVFFVLVSYLPIPNKIGEMKTKPTQYAVRTVNSYGLHPDIIIARSSEPVDNKRKEKIALASNIPPGQIISAPDVDNIYDIPLNFEKDGLTKTLLRLLGLQPRTKDLLAWRRMVNRAKAATETVRIALVGKYFRTGNFLLSDVYLSVIEALRHAAAREGHRVAIDWLDVTQYEQGDEALANLRAYDGVVVPGGFGARGVEGKIRVIEYVRTNKIPYFGLCYGMQLAVVEYARHVLGLAEAHTTEVDPKTAAPVITVMESQKKNLVEAKLGGTMRLGGYPAVLAPGSIARRVYGQRIIRERHRHRYEVNPDFIEALTEAGMVFSGRSPDGRLMEIMELAPTTHPFFVGTQFHPEFTSSPLNPHPLFLEFVRATINYRQQKEPKFDSSYQWSAAHSH